MTARPNSNSASFGTAGSGNLRVISACPFCSTNYSLTTAKVLAESDEAHLLYLECGKCSSAVVALITTSNMGVSSVGLVTDLTSDDVIKFTGANEVSVDDAIDLHGLLRSPADLLAPLIEV